MSEALTTIEGKALTYPSIAVDEPEACLVAAFTIQTDDGETVACAGWHAVAERADLHVSPGVRVRVRGVTRDEVFIASGLQILETYGAPTRGPVSVLS